ncbi:unnamed protein product [Hermetia illucens]|uniref:Mediator of RNA polymerase II transcription subunit 9 n=1 Tax=Hermetia illucens TaxID=343691 RepID=A0A7R8YN83_HERIL|nr:mediator of RNA polymerase II transcription subunit 9 [Hermetia illucens]CAD7079021.1 unnamed protein product [Hermetia illucens]
MEQFPSEQNDKSAILNNVVGPQTSQLTVGELDIEILPVIYDIIRCVEKNPVDNAAKQRESQECSQKILELQKRFDSARSQIRQLPGIDYNKEEQLQKLEQLKSQLMLKQKLIKKYKNKPF